MNVPVTPVGHWYVCMHLFFSCYLQWNLQKFVIYHDRGDYFTTSFFFFWISIDLILFRVHQGNKILTMTWAKENRKKKNSNNIHVENDDLIRPIMAKTALLSRATPCTTRLCLFLQDTPTHLQLFDWNWHFNLSFPCCNSVATVFFVGKFVILFKHHF